MFAPTRNPVAIPVEVVLANGLSPYQTGFADVRLERPDVSGRAPRTWTAVVTVIAPVAHDPDAVLAEAQGFLVDDREGPLGVVDEVVSDAEGKGDGTITVACGWFGRFRLTLGFQDVAEISPAERRLIVRGGLPAVAEVRRRLRTRGSGVAGRVRVLADHLFGRSRRKRERSG
jgi:hypothetical protein